MKRCGGRDLLSVSAWSYGGKQAGALLPSQPDAYAAPAVPRLVLAWPAFAFDFLLAGRFAIGMISPSISAHTFVQRRCPFVANRGISLAAG